MSSDDIGGLGVGAFAVELWREADRDPSRRWAPREPVWEIMAWGSVARVRAIGGGQESVLASGDLRLATDDEVARAREVPNG